MSCYVLCDNRSAQLRYPLSHTTSYWPSNCSA